MAGHRREALDLRQVDAVGRRARDDRLGERVLGVLLERRGEREDLALLVALEQHDVGHFRLAVRERAGLVEDDRRDLVRGLERVAALDEDAVLGALAGADHDRRRRGQAERARARDDDDRDAGEQRGDPPAVRGGGHGDRLEDREHVRGIGVAPKIGGPRKPQNRNVSSAAPMTNGTNTALMRSAKRWTGRLGALRVLDEPDDLGESGVGADLRRPEPEAAELVHRRADDGVASDSSRRGSTRR